MCRGIKDVVDEFNDVLGENFNKVFSKFSDLNSDRNSVYDGNEDSDSSYNEMEIGIEIDEDFFIFNRVIKKQMMSKIMVFKLLNYKKSLRFK